MRSHNTRSTALLATIVAFGTMFVAASGAAGLHLSFGSHVRAHEEDRTISITPSGGTGANSTTLSFGRLMPGAAQSLTLYYRNSGNTNEDVWIVFPNATALSALNNLGEYELVQITADGSSALGQVFWSDNLNDHLASCGNFSPSGCWPLGSQYKLATRLSPSSRGSFTFRFEFATAYNTQPKTPADSLWNYYPVSGQATVKLSDGVGSGLPYELVATQPGITPGQVETIHQRSPFVEELTEPASGAAFSDQLHVVESSTSTTFVVTSPNSHLRVTPSGEVTTLGGPLPAGHYYVAGTDSDANNDSGTWHYILNVLPNHRDP